MKKILSEKEKCPDCDRAIYGNICPCGYKKQTGGIEYKSKYIPTGSGIPGFVRYMKPHQREDIEERMRYAPKKSQGATTEDISDYWLTQIGIINPYMKQTVERIINGRQKKIN